MARFSSGRERFDESRGQGYRVGSRRFGPDLHWDAEREGNGRQSFAGLGPKDYKRSDDRIREDISDRLTDDHELDASGMTVQVQNGEVTLSGSVSDRYQKRRAEDIAERVSGVRDVVNRLRIEQGHIGEPGREDGPLNLSGERPRTA